MISTGAISRHIASSLYSIASPCVQAAVLRCVRVSLWGRDVCASKLGRNGLLHFPVGPF